MKKIILDTLVDNHKCITPDEGAMVYDLLVDCIKNEEKVVLDFYGLEIVTTAYLNIAIGKLYKDYTSEKLNDIIKFDNLDEDNARRIKQVAETAKMFYEDEKAFEETLNV